MKSSFTLEDISALFPTNDACLDEIRKLRYPNGILCTSCNKITKFYKVKNRKSYACEFCRSHISPLSGTIFDKSSTPLRRWFLAMFLMVVTKGDISSRKLQRELGVTYKTAWRMYKSIRSLMAQNNGDLLTQSKEFSWKIFKRLEFKVLEKTIPPEAI